jgi:putative salt-induced outer membrane protein YdiY
MLSALLLSPALLAISLATVSYQPNVQAANWRAANAAAIIVAINRRLSLKVSNDIEYRNLPVFGFRRTDARTAGALVITLRAR